MAIFYYIRLLFGLLCAFFCHPVVTFCSVLFLVVLCIYPSSPSAPVTICTLCYRITFVVCRKASRNWKKNMNTACPEVIMYCYTSCGYAKWWQKHWFLIVKDSKWRKKIKGCWIYFHLFWTLWNARCRWHSSQTAAAQCEPTQTESLHRFTGSPVHESSRHSARQSVKWKKPEHSDGALQQHRSNLSAELNLSLNIHVMYLCWQSQNTRECNKNRITNRPSAHKDKILNTFHEYSQGWAVSSKYNML